MTPFVAFVVALGWEIASGVCFWPKVKSYDGRGMQTSGSRVEDEQLNRIQALCCLVNEGKTVIPIFMIHSQRPKQQSGVNSTLVHSVLFVLPDYVEMTEEPSSLPISNPTAQCTVITRFVIYLLPVLSPALKSPVSHGHTLQQEVLMPIKHSLSV